MTDHRHRPVIAVVDDDQRVLESLALLLDSADYDVRLFSTAAAVLACEDFAAIDCVISDVAMPFMDGVALARAAQLVRPALPVILITGRMDLLQQSARDRPEPYRVFKKPFDGPDLLAAIAESLRGPSRRPPRS